MPYHRPQTTSATSSRHDQPRLTAQDLDAIVAQFRGRPYRRPSRRYARTLGVPQSRDEQLTKGQCRVDGLQTSGSTALYVRLTIQLFITCTESQPGS